MSSLPKPEFIQRDPQQIISEMRQQYETLIGRSLEPAQVESLLIQAMAYRELLLRNQVQEAALQNLLAFSRFPMIDYLGELLGVQRLPATAATATIELTIVSGHNGVTVPAGTRIGTVDGRAIFEIMENVVVPIGSTTATTIAECQTAGKVGNGYDANTITQILDPQAFLSAAANSTISAGGADGETDEALRQRIRLAPSAFSTAGSKGAYRFHARAAHPSIVDVEVLGPNDDQDILPGEVHIFPLVEGGITTPQAVIDAVQAACSADRVRPLTDTVMVSSPTKVDYTLNVAITLFNTADSSAVLPVVTQRLQDFVDEKKNLLGRDIVRAQIIERSTLLGQVYNVNVVSPSADLVIANNEFSNCTGITVTVAGFNAG